MDRDTSHPCRARISDGGRHGGDSRDGKKVTTLTHPARRSAAERLPWTGRKESFRKKSCRCHNAGSAAIQKVSRGSKGQPETKIQRSQAYRCGVNQLPVSSAKSRKPTAGCRIKEL